MIVERTLYYAKSGMADRVLAVRRRASDIRVGLGLTPGVIMTRRAGFADGPDVTWQAEFPDAECHAADLAARQGSPEFDAVRTDMGPLLERFERQVFDSVPPRADAHWAGSIDLANVPIVPERLPFSSHGRELIGFLFRPPGPGPFPAMVYNHGSGVTQGTQDQCKPTIAATLMSWGIAAFLPHRRGYGESPGTPWRNDVAAAFGTEDYDTQLAARLDAESDDVVAAGAFLRTRPDIRAEHIGVMGSSFGGTNTLLAAAKEPAFRCAVDFAGAAMNWERTPALRRLMTVAALALTQPIFFIQADNDYSTAPTRDLADALRHTGKVVQARVYPAFGLTREEGHLFERNGPMIWGPDVRRFLERWL